MLLINVGYPRPRDTAELVLCAATGLWAAGLLAAGTAGGVLVAGWLGVLHDVLENVDYDRGLISRSISGSIGVKMPGNREDAYQNRDFSLSWRCRVGRWQVCWFLLCCAGQMASCVGGMSATQKKIPALALSSLASEKIFSTNQTQLDVSFQIHYAA